MRNFWYYPSNRYNHGINKNNNKIDYDESAEKWDDDSIYRLLTPCTFTKSAKKQKLKMKVKIKTK